MAVGAEHDAAGRRQELAPLDPALNVRLLAAVAGGLIRLRQRFDLILARDSMTNPFFPTDRN